MLESGPRSPAWELIRNENSQASPQSYCIINSGVWHRDLCFNKPSRIVGCTLKLEKHCSR